MLRRYKTSSLVAYLVLIRFSNQFGTLLLFIPCFYGLALAHNVTAGNIILFLISAFLARSCGCILNDIADQKIDCSIPTTKDRPLASNRLNTSQALAAFAILCVSGLPLLSFYSKHIFPILIIIGALVVIYPYSKRFFALPQLILGLTYSSGFILATVHGLDVPLYFLHPKIFVFYLGMVLWVIIFDTIYAKRDLLFDYKAGVNSATITFQKYFKLTVVTISILIIMFTIFLYTPELLLVFIPFAVYMVVNFIKRKEETYLFKINTVLILLALLANVLFSIEAWNLYSYILLTINVVIQCTSVFMKPSQGFRFNALCVIPLALVFLV